VKAGYVAERVKDGRFQAMMEVALVNDGPVSVFSLLRKRTLLELLLTDMMPFPFVCSGHV
jgi:hypothetical protein